MIETHAARVKPVTAQLIFNPSAGDAAASHAQLHQLRETLRALDVRAVVHHVGPGSRVPVIAAHAVRRGIPYVIVAGGDGTIDLAARSLAGTRTTLVVIPTGTRNNIARSLNIPNDLTAAAELIRSGMRQAVDLGRVRMVGRETVFVELTTIGLGAALFEPADDIQHGRFERIGDLLGTFVTQPAAKFHLNLDRGRQRLTVEAFLLLVVNMPYLGANYQLASQVSAFDGMLDLFLYADLNKLDLLTYAAQVARGLTEDERVRHVRVKQLTVETDPPMPLLLDGNVIPRRVLQNRALHIRSYPRGLHIMLPRTE